MAIDSLRDIARIKCGTTALLALALVFAATAQAVPGQEHPATFLEGKLVQGQHGPELQAHNKDVRLTAVSTYLLHTLEDSRLSNREVRIEGTMKPGGSFEARRLFTVRDGKLYRVRYYCDVCNIAALEPGKCVCCQRPTELQEIPVSQTDKDTIAD